MPGTATSIIVALSSFIYVDALLVDEWLHPLLFSDDFDYEPLNQYFERNGYDSQNVIKIMGSALVYMGIILFLLVLKLATARIECLTDNKVIKWLCKDVMWCGVFRFFMEQAEPLLIGSLLQVRLVSKHKD